MRLRTMLLVTSSGTYSPASMKRLASTPSGVPSETLARKMSPVEIAGIPKCSATNLAWVPLPAPGGPIMISRIFGMSPSAMACCAPPRGDCRHSRRSSMLAHRLRPRLYQPHRETLPAAPGERATPLPQESFVVALLQLALDLLHRV